MKKYTYTVRATNEEELKKDAINICQELDAKANIVESSLEEMVFTRIRLRKEVDKKFYNKRESSRDRNKMRENVRVPEEMVFTRIRLRKEVDKKFYNKRESS